MLRHLLYLTLGLAAGLVLGYLGGQSRPAESTVSGHVAHVPAVSETRPAPRTSVPSVPAVDTAVASRPAVQDVPVDEVARIERTSEAVRSFDTSARRIAEIAAQRDPVLRMTQLAELLSGLDASNARRIADAFRTNERGWGERGGWGGNRELNLVLDAWGRVDGPAAVAYAQMLRDPQATSSAVTGWAMRDPVAAREWALKQTDEADNPWMVPVIAGASRTALADAMTMLYALPFGAARGRALDSVIEAQSALGTFALRNWAEQISDERLRQGTVARVAPILARDDPRKAAEWAVQYAGPERIAQALVPVLSTWAERDGAAALDWAYRLDPAMGRSAAMDSALNAWANRDPAAVESWITKAEPGPELDRARISIGMRYFNSDPVRAMSWVSTVSDEGMRNRILERIASSWSERDPEAAAKFLNSTP